MNTIVKGISICLLSLLLLAAVSCAGQEAPATPAASAPEETAVTTAPPLAATNTAEPQPTATVPPVSSPTIIIPTREETAVPPTSTPLPADSESTVERVSAVMPRFAAFNPAPVDVARPSSTSPSPRT